MRYGSLKVMLAEIPVKIAQPIENAKNHIELMKSANADNVNLLLFSELSLTGYTCADLFLTSELISASGEAIRLLINESKTLDVITIVGAPMLINGALYNCAIVIYKGDVLGIVPKSHIPNYHHNYEGRYFTSGLNLPTNITVSVFGNDVKFGTQLLFACQNMKEFTFGIEISHDMLAPISPSASHSIAGANLICNLAASAIHAGESARIERIVTANSQRLKCAYLYSSGAHGESTTDLYYSSDKIIAAMDTVTSEDIGVLTEIIDLQEIAGLRRNEGIFSSVVDSDYSYIRFEMNEYSLPIKARSKTPFLPEKGGVKDFLSEVFEIQTMGLIRRMEGAKARSLTIGISGGLDSTLSLLVCHNAMKKMGLPTNKIHAVTMPCFGTTKKSYKNGNELMDLLGCNSIEINIKDAVTDGLKMIDHDFSPDTTYENAQARQRAMLLMNIANKYGSIVVGTSDLSAIAIGFSTYGGHHMSMYNVNSSIPKTTVRELIRHYADQCDNSQLADVLHDIADAPISPELLPINDDGEQEQVTESIVGNYEIIDFILYHQIKFGFSEEKIAQMLKATFKGDFPDETIENTVKSYFKRFYANQLKRSCMPDGIKAMEISLSPRGSLRLPSDL